MARSYVIEPPAERQREMSRDRKLDRIIDLLAPKAPDDSGSPEVVFEPEPDQLPTVDELPKEDGEGETGAEGQGEGTANVADGREQHGFKHPSMKRHGMPR